jgi:hypothetical protein
MLEPAAGEAVVFQFQLVNRNIPEDEIFQIIASL